DEVKLGAETQAAIKTTTLLGSRPYAAPRVVLNERPYQPGRRGAGAGGQEPVSARARTRPPPECASQTWLLEFGIVDLNRGFNLLSEPEARDVAGC
ncbi:hypothetical protein RBA42_24910, partial [Mycobacteroides abscessus subsp. abscessus]